MPSLHDIIAFLDEYLRTSTYPPEQHAVLRASGAPIARLGLALDPEDAMRLPDVATLDALLLHRWWGYDTIPLSPDAGVVGYHQPFDDRLTLSDNPFLASLLGMMNAEPMHAGDGRLIGVLGDVPATDMNSMTSQLTVAFGGLDVSEHPSRASIARVAAVNAMTEALVHDAHARGADLYVTGQLRVPAKAAVAETGIGVIAIGHARLERWGLSCLESLLRERWPVMETVTTGSQSACLRGVPR